MTRRFINYSFAAMIICLFAITSCTKDEGIDESYRGQQGEIIDVPFTMAVDALTAGNDGLNLLNVDEQLTTRTIPSGIVDGADAPIKNLWVIQFDGKTTDSKVVGVPHYIGPDDINNTTKKGVVQLMASVTDCYIVWIANLPQGASYSWGLSPTSTFKDVTDKMITINEESDTYATLSGEKTILMNAITATPVQTGTDLLPVFERNVSKVSLSLSVANVADLKVISVRLRNIPRNISLADKALEINGLVSPGTIYPYGSPTIDYSSLTTEELTSTPYPEAGQSQIFSWYIPRNQQGTRTTTGQYADKSYYAPTNATYFEITVQKGQETGVFRVYPGKNQVDDYNIEPNHHYTTSLNIVGIGDANTQDSRVENFDDVDYTGTLSNCYILNPMPAGGRDRKYKIPVSQVNRYWSNGGANNVEGYGTATNAIGSSDAWTVMLLWCDNTEISSVGGLISKSVGNGPDDYFEITIPAGLCAGNFAVKIYKNTHPQITLWSWHFWVTDYNPNAFSTSVINNTESNPGNIPNGIFTYPVPGGQVERYVSRSGGLWTTAYQNSVMMDRSVGAMSDYFTANMTTRQGLLHYQYGRKDPFPANSLSVGLVTKNDDDNQITIAQSVMNPLKFQNRKVTGQNWSSEASGTAYLWNDPKTDASGKSIYDPCPVGWKLPIDGTWSDFAATSGNYITTQNPQRDLGYTYGRGVGVSGGSAVNGLRYWPSTATDNTNADPAGGRIWYSATGNRTSTTGDFNVVGSNGYYWSSTPYSSAYGRSLYFYSGYVYPSSNANRAYGFAVRCVSE